MRLLWETLEEKPYDSGLGNDFLDMTSKAQKTKANNRQTEPHQTLKVLSIKRNSQQSDKPIYRMGKYL